MDFRIDQSVSGGTDKLAVVDLWGEVFSGSLSMQRVAEKLGGGNAGFLRCRVELPCIMGNPG